MKTNQIIKNAIKELDQVLVRLEEFRLKSVSFVYKGVYTNKKPL